MPKTKLYPVSLSEDERRQLKRRVKGRLTARQRVRLRVLLLGDEEKTDAVIAEQCDTSLRTVERIRKRFAEQGLQAALLEKPRSGKPRKLKANQEAVLVELACSEPPEGHVRWNARLLANRMVEMEVAESISGETVRRLLKKIA